MHIREWLQNDVFHARWWILIALIILISVIWWIMVDKARLFEISLFAVLAIILTIGIHEYGEELTLWEYPIDIIAIFPPLTSINLISLPLIYSIVYQHCKNLRSFIWAVLITSAILCFICEPLLSWGGFYLQIHWEYYFSFPVYSGMAIGVRFIIKKAYSITCKERRGIL